MKKSLQILIFAGGLLIACVYTTASGPVLSGDPVVALTGDPDLQAVFLQQPPPGGESSEPVFVFVEEQALFQGGDLNHFLEWVQENIVYPKEDLANNIFGRVTVQFAVNPEGKVYNVAILRGMTPTINEEVKRVLLSSPDWAPAKQAGKPVAQQFTIPVVFTLP